MRERDFIFSSPVFILLLLLFLQENNALYKDNFWIGSFWRILYINCFSKICRISFADLIMGCIKSKENKSPAIKYRPENTLEPASTSVSHHGAEHTSAALSSSTKSTSVNFSNLSMTPFGGSSGVTPFGGASSSFSVVPSSYPAGLTGEI